MSEMAVMIPDDLDAAVAVGIVDSMLLPLALSAVGVLMIVCGLWRNAVEHGSGLSQTMGCRPDSGGCGRTTCAEACRKILDSRGADVLRSR